MKKIVLIALGATALAMTMAKAPPPRRRQKPKAKPSPDGTTPDGLVPEEEEVSGMASDVMVFDPEDPPPDPEEFDYSPPCETFEQEGERGFVMAKQDYGGACTPPWDLVPEQRTSAPLAETSGVDPLWPILTQNQDKVQVSYRDVRGKWHGKWGYHVGSTRKGDDGSKRHHSGMDLFADEGDVVQAMEDGEVIAMLPFHHGTWAMYVRNADGKIVNYGEVEKGSWTEFGLPMQVIEGQTDTVLVKRGDPIARVGRQSGGSTMLHFETYEPEITLADIRGGGLQWPFGESAPIGLLDPSKYLVAAQHTWFFEREPENA